jgi:hypothetical protein
MGPLLDMPRFSHENMQKYALDLCFSESLAPLILSAHLIIGWIPWLQFHDREDQ